MGVIAQPDVVLFGRRLAADQAFVWLAAGTVLTIALASYLEEFIIKSLPHYDFFFTMAFFELAVFGVVSHVTIRLRAAGERASLGADAVSPRVSPGQMQMPHHPPRWSDVEWWRLEPRAAPFRLYAIGATCLALYASLGKLAYKYVNYVTGTVLKSIKLVPVMVVSVTWLGRSYSSYDYAAAGFLTTSAVMFGMGEAESNHETNYAMGFILSFVCLGLTAAQSNIADACMRDHGAGVDENMLKHFGAVAAVAVTTARKAVTVMLSFALFRSDKPLTEKYLGATALFFGAIACEYYKAEARRRRAKAAMEKGVVGVDAEGGKGDELNTSEGGELPWGGRRSVDGRGVATRGMDRELAPVRLK